MRLSDDVMPDTYRKRRKSNDSFERVKDVTERTKPKKKRKKHGYFDRDDPANARERSEFSDDDEIEIISAFRARFSKKSDSDGGVKGESTNANGSEEAGPSSKNERPIIIDDRRRNGSRHQERKGTNERSIIRIDHRFRGGYDRNDRRGRQRSPKRSKNDSTRRERHERKADQNDDNWRKYELCKYYLAGTCRKGERCHYMHKNYPCKYYHISKNCENDNCIFSHAKLDAVTAKIIEKHKSDFFVADDSVELEFIKNQGFDPLPRPPVGVPLLPPPSENATTNLFDLDDIFGVSVEEELMETSSEMSNKPGSSKPTEGSAASVGWIKFAWHDKTEPVPMTGDGGFAERFSPSPPPPIKPLGFQKGYDDRFSSIDNPYDMPPIRRCLQPSPPRTQSPVQKDHDVLETFNGQYNEPKRLTLDFSQYFRDPSEKTPVRRYRRPSKPCDPRLETAHIPMTVSGEVQDPRLFLPRPATPPTDLPVPELIDLVDFRPKFTLNGKLYKQQDNC
ncbi:Oidioi.mRNA.OKI2018_I69.XSR.g14715.t1.cds [Oikopleura dioica]|uniref:Oidioi.mRNA.OKI2018_I69.XSR.g14715.t1.cds n=1 Tax=Oikopleura dioica TaxID=34765 RepID=A0ABN7SAL5_OIKDI|nr:Oidioi.mRNA.OKI2018_I69.XSR.g14715.t1.cds [Oikopleura dioica]